MASVASHRVGTWYAQYRALHCIASHCKRGRSTYNMVSINLILRRETSSDEIFHFEFSGVSFQQLIESITESKGLGRTLRIFNRLNAHHHASSASHSNNKRHSHTTTHLTKSTSTQVRPQLLTATDRSTACIRQTLRVPPWSNTGYISRILIVPSRFASIAAGPHERDISGSGA